jgi:hypothetical protein
VIFTSDNGLFHGEHRIWTGKDDVYEEVIRVPLMIRGRTRDYLYAVRRTGAEELYDMRADPFQLRSRHDDPAFAEIKVGLADRLAELRDCSGRSCRE